VGIVRTTKSEPPIPSKPFGREKLHHCEIATPTKNEKKLD